jgi:hypothetical protein
MSFTYLGTSKTTKHRRSTALSPKKNEEQIGRDGRLITTPPTFEWTRNENTIISNQRKVDPFII